VYIVPGNTAIFDPVTKIIKIGLSTPQFDIENAMLEAIIAQIQHNKNVFMAFDNAKNNITHSAIQQKAMVAATQVSETEQSSANTRAVFDYNNLLYPCSAFLN